MAHFAEINQIGIVTRVIVVPDEVEAIGSQWCHNLLGGNWVQTSYNNTIRKNFAGIGYVYDEERDAFIPPKPFISWTLNEETCQWQAPIPLPDDGKRYSWDEQTLSWIEIDDI